MTNKAEWQIEVRLVTNLVFEVYGKNIWGFLVVIHAQKEKRIMMEDIDYNYPHSYVEREKQQYGMFRAWIYF